MANIKINNITVDKNGIKSNLSALSLDQQAYILGGCKCITTTDGKRTITECF